MNTRLRMRRIPTLRLLLLALAPSLAACTQLMPRKETAFAGEQANVERIIDACLLRRRTWEKLEQLCNTAPRRLSGSQGAERAVEWARAQMIADGLENVRLEECEVPFWERGELEQLTLLGPASHAGLELPILALGGSVPTPAAGIEAEVVIVDGLDGLDEVDVRGKIVLFNGALDPTARNTFRAYGGAAGQRVRGATQAAKRGAVAAIVRSLSSARDDFPHTGMLRYADGVERIPAAAISTNGAALLARLASAGHRLRLGLRLTCRWRESVISYNVVGELVGREEPEEIVLVGAHLDAWDVGQGAHDDGAGCCQAIEALAVLKDLGLRPRRTLRAVLFMNEENGLAGARAYYERHWDELPEHVLALESDRGAFTPRGFTTNANPKALAILRDAASLLGGTGADRVIEGGGGADISPLGKDGVVLAGYLPDSQRYFDLHHSARDTLDQVNVRELELGSASIASFIYLVANMPQTLPRNPDQ